MPVFPGGEGALNKYLITNLKYPDAALKQKIQGKVYVAFVVDYTGKVTDAKILRGIGGGCDEEALRVMRSMPAWIPGKQNGKAVNVQFNLPVVFSIPPLKEEEKK